MRSFSVNRKSSRSAKHFHLRKLLRYEPLESRHMMAGLVTPDATYNPANYSTMANGLPILNSFSAGRGAVYLDYDGHDVNGDGDWDDSGEKVPYDRDGDPTTFSASEQATIVNVYRKVAMGLSMFDLNITTIKPTTKPFTWMIMTSSTSGGGLASYNSFGNPSGPGSNRANGNSPYIILHEIGHTLGLRHDSTYDTLGVAVDEYGAWNQNIDYFHGMIMGEHDGAIATYNNWHTTTSNTNAQDDFATMAAEILTEVSGGDGFRPDYGNNSIANATPMNNIGGNSTSDWDIIDRKGDIDYYKLTPTVSGYYNFMAGRNGAVSPVNLKLSILNSTGTTVLASEDGDPKIPFTTDVGGVAYSPMNYDHNLRLWLTSGTTYIVKIEGHGNYSDVGQYALRSDLLSTSATEKWQSEGIGFTGVPGYADNNSGTYTVAGSGSDIDGVVDDTAQFVYQTLAGNGEIIAHVVSNDNDGGWAGSGVMIRESIATNARSLAMINSPAGSYAVTRSTTGGTSSSISAGTYTWFRIVRSGTNGETFTFYGKANSGDAWTQIGTPSTLTGMTGTVQLGLVSVDARRKAFKDQTLSVGTLDNVSIVLGTGGVLNPDLATNTLTIPTITVGTVTNSSVTISWNNVSGDNGYIVERSTDRINWTQVSGALSSSTFSFTDSTVNEAQTYYYVVRAKTGTTSPAYSVRASGSNQPGTSITTKAGPVTDLRLMSVSGTQILLDWRDASGESSYTIMRKLSSGSTYTAVATGIAANTTIYTDSGLTANTSYDYKVRTVRPDGTTVDTAAQTVFTRQTGEVTGVAVTARTTSSLTLSWNAYAGATSYLIYKREVSGGDGTGGPWTYGETSVLAAEVTAPTTTYTDSASLSPLNEVYYFVVAKTAGGASTATATNTALAMVPTADTLPTGWSSYDVGQVGGPSAFAVDPGTGMVTLYAAGRDLFGSNDAYRGLVVSRSGVNDITTRVTANNGGYAGVMVRESDSPTARSFFFGDWNEGQAFTEIRTTTGGASVETEVTTSSGYIFGVSWIQVSRSGNTLTAFLSNDEGANWTVVKSQTFSSLAATLLYEVVYSNVDTQHFEGADFMDIQTHQDGYLFPPSLMMGGGGAGSMMMSGGNNAASPGEESFDTATISKFARGFSSTGSAESSARANRLNDVADFFGSDFRTTSTSRISLSRALGESRSSAAFDFKRSNSNRIESAVETADDFATSSASTRKTARDKLDAIFEEFFESKV